MRLVFPCEYPLSEGSAREETHAKVLGRRKQFLFGAANQLLASLVLISIAVFLRTTERKGWMLYVPMTFMFLVTMSALVMSVYGIVGKLMNGGFVFLVDGLQLLLALALMTLALLVVKHCAAELVTDKAEHEARTDM